MPADGGFVLLLKQLSFSDNTLRQEAEARYEAFKTTGSAEELLSLLLSTLVDMQVEEYVRQLSCVLLRRSLVGESVSCYTKLPAERRKAFRDALLAAVSTVQPHAMRLKLAELAAEATSYMLAADNAEDALAAANFWPEFVLFAVQAAQSADKSQREIGLTILGYLSMPMLEAAAATVTSSGQQHAGVAVFINLMRMNLAEVGSSEPDPSPLAADELVNAKLSLLSMQALCTILLSMNSEADTDCFQCLIPALLHSLQCLLQLLSKALDSSSCRSSGSGNNEASLQLLLQHQQQVAEQFESMGLSFLESMVEIAEDKPLFFGSTLHLYFQQLMEIIECPTAAAAASLVTNSNSCNSNSSMMSAAVQHMVLEFLATVCCASAKRVRKFKGPDGRSKHHFAQRLLPHCLLLMSQLDDCNIQQWAAASTLEDITSPTAAATTTAAAEVGEDAFSRICTALGCNCTYSIVSAALAPYITSSHWQQQHAALQAMGAYFEVSALIADASQLLLHQREVAATLLHFAEHPHPRVRSQALLSLNQFLLMHGPALEDAALSRLFAVLLSAATANGTTATATTTATTAATAAGNVFEPLYGAARIRRSALLALTSFVDVAAADFTTQRAPQLLHCAAVALQHGPSIVQEASIALILSLTSVTSNTTTQYSIDNSSSSNNSGNDSSDTSSDSNVWVRHYGDIMPLLQQLLQQLQSSCDESLWCLTLECAAAVGEAAGRQLFYADAVAMMNALLVMQQQQQLGADSDAEIGLMKAWVRIARALGSDFLPYLPMIMQKLFNAMSQDITVHIDDDCVNLQELEERSDVELIEADNGSGWLAVRTAAVEEQASACQMIILLTEKLQEKFYPYAEQSVRLFAALLHSAQDDIRSYSLVALPQLLRVTAIATASHNNNHNSSSGDNNYSDNSSGVVGRSAVEEMAAYLLGLLLKSVEVESALETIVTGLQALKSVLVNACTNWSSDTAVAATTTTTTALQQMSTAGRDREWIPFLLPEQMNSIAQCIKIVLRDSIQRRALLRAEAAVSGDSPDEDDAAEELLFLQESRQLHFHIAEVIGALCCTHGEQFLSVFSACWSDTVLGMCHPYCIEADRQFAAFVLSDVIEFAVGDATTATTTTAAEYFASFVPPLIEMLQQSIESGPRRTAAYALGVACEKNPRAFSNFAISALQALASSIARGDDAIATTAATTAAGASRGECTDNAVAAVGVILEQMLLLQRSDLPYSSMWAQWLHYLPLRADQEEGCKVIRQLLRLLQQRCVHVLSPDEHLVQSTRILLQALQEELLPSALAAHCADSLRALCSGADSPPIIARPQLLLLSQQLGDALAHTLHAVLTNNSSGNNNSMSSIASRDQQHLS